MGLLLVVGGLIVALLSLVAIYLNWKVYLVKREQYELRSKLNADRERQRLQLNQSIQIICRALLAGQVGVAEASIRICGLMDQLSVPIENRSDLISFQKLADSIRHVPILDEWKKLPLNKRREYEKLIAQEEDKLSEFVLVSAERLIGREF